jgi:hypothetical protein
MRLGVMLAALVTAVLSSPAQAQAPNQEHVRGVIRSLAGDSLKVETAPGRTVDIKLPAELPVSQVEEADPGAISQGAYIGTTAVPQPDGTLRALEVHVFAESMRGAGEGHRPWDLGPKSSMTNATVSGMKENPAKGSGAGSSMTNATVAGVDGKGGARTLSLTYPGGSQTVVVPPNTPIVKMEPGDRSLLVPGAHVIVFATGQAGAPIAQRIAVGKDGVVPPM